MFPSVFPWLVLQLPPAWKTPFSCLFSSLFSNSCHQSPPCAHFSTQLSSGVQVPSHFFCASSTTQLSSSPHSVLMHFSIQGLLHSFSHLSLFSSCLLCSSSFLLS